MKDPLVTIVTPSYNQGRFIRATIESVLAQDYPNIEYIIMDGGSTDETASIVRQYGGRLRWISEKDRGQSDAINKGFRMAKGEIVSWLNSDDVILSGAVRHAVAAFEAKPELGAVYGEGYLMDEAGNVTGRFPATEPFNLWKLVYLSDYVLQQTLYFRKSVFEEIGYLDESLHWGMDWDILIRIGKRYMMGYIPHYMGCLREYGAAKTFSGGAKRFRELASIMRRHGSRRYPPGFITYGLDTYGKIWCDWIERWTPRFMERPSKILQKKVFDASRFVIDRTIREAQGWYSDGWAAPILSYMLPPGSGGLCITGELPALSGELGRQELRVFSGGQLIGQSALSPGPFALTLDCPSSPASPVSLTIRASRFIIPERCGLGPDRRRLAYILRTIH
jgi:glycosyltransferase involved in cell wall biosynthesis